MAIRENTVHCISQAPHATYRLSPRLLLSPLALGARHGDFAVFLRLHCGKRLRGALRQVFQVDVPQVPEV